MLSSLKFLMRVRSRASHTINSLAFSKFSSKLNLKQEKINAQKRAQETAAVKQAEDLAKDNKPFYQGDELIIGNELILYKSYFVIIILN